MAELALVATRPGRAVVAAPTVRLVIVQVDLFCGMAGTATQSKSSWLALASLVQTMGHVLPAYGWSAASVDEATSAPLIELSAALGDALALVSTCQSPPGVFSCLGGAAAREAEIEALGTRIRDCFQSLSLVNQARIISQNEQLLAAAAAAAAAPPRRTFCITLTATDEQISAAIAAVAGPAAVTRRRY